MTISAAYSLRNSLLLIVLAVILAGCIQPDAPDPDLPPTVPAQILPTAAIPVTGIANPTVPAPPVSNNATTRPPETGLRVWRTAPVGPESVVVMFFPDASGARCVRYIFRSKIVPRCAAPGQTVIGVTGSEQAANNKMYTIITGFILDDRITVVSVQMQDGTSIPIEVNDRGFIAVLEGVQKATVLVPVDQFGNLVGSQSAL